MSKQVLYFVALILMVVGCADVKPQQPMNLRGNDGLSADSVRACESVGDCQAGEICYEQICQMESQVHETPVVLLEIDSEDEEIELIEMRTESENGSGIDVINERLLFVQADDSEDECIEVFWFIDSDHDGAGDMNQEPRRSCNPPWPSAVQNGNDCDDTSSDVHPGAVEICDDGIDNDCDHQVDEGCEEVYNPDQPDPEECLPDSGRDCDGDGFVGQNDCDETNPDIHVFALEDCHDGIDNDCNGDIDDDDVYCQVIVPEPDPEDLDGDGFDTDTDCDDGNALINPEAVEVCNGLDDNCDGVIDPDELCLSPVVTDLDQDGYTVEDGDCQDENPDVHPNAIELCDFIDNDCNGQIDDGLREVRYLDTDGDGYGQNNIVMTCQFDDPVFVTISGDCNDGDETINPDAVEICGDGIDQDCDGEDLVCPDSDPDIDVDCESTDICGDGIDNDCNGLVDDSCGLSDGVGRCDGHVVCIEDQDGDGHAETACIDAVLFTQGSLFRNEAAYVVGYNAFDWSFDQWDLTEPTDDGFFCVDFTNKPVGLARITLVSEYAIDGITLVLDAIPGMEVWLQNYGYCTSNTASSLDFCHAEGGFNYLLGFIWDGQNLSKGGNL